MSTNLILGIANLGDLLIHNKITDTVSDGSIENITLKIPEYQRPYKWGAKNVNQLLDDIDEARNSNKEIYRVGTLILHYDEKDHSYFIVDGQQRVITFSLLLKCLGEDGIDFLHQSLSNNEYNLHNIMNNYRVLGRRIRKYADDYELKALYDYIIERCEMIVVITDNLSEAFQFFDSQNARGKELYPHDLLKAYHLREMNDLDADQTEKVVKVWENLDQKKLSVLFKDYLYRVKEWLKGNKAFELNEKNIDLFKGVTRRDNYPFAQFYKGAFAYADDLNHSKIPFVTGIQKLPQFQLDTPIIAGKPFFDYAKHYFDILTDIQNNDKYEGYFINDNEIVKTLDTRRYSNGVGNRVTRLMFDTAILLYVDRFCPPVPSKSDIEYLDQFVVYAFIWAYSLRAQYYSVGWSVAQNYIMGRQDVRNSFNIYKMINDSDSPVSLFSRLSDSLMPLHRGQIRANMDDLQKESDLTDGEIFTNYLSLFMKYDYLEVGK